MVEINSIDIENRCNQVIMFLEGNGSFMVKMEESGLNPTDEFVAFVVEEASKDLDTVLHELMERKKNGEIISPIDPNVFIAYRLSLYFSSWYAFVTKLKSTDRNRSATDKLDYLVANRSFVRDVVSAIESGEELALPIMEDRLSKKDKQEHHERYED